MAKARTTTVNLQKFFAAQADRNRWIEFDDDEFVECVALGSLPRSFVDDGVALSRDILALDLMPDIEKNRDKRTKMLEDIQKRQAEIRSRERVRMLVKWLVRDPVTQEPFPLPKWHIELPSGQMVIDDDPFARMDLNLERTLTHAIYAAFDTTEEQRRSLGEESASEPPSEVKEDTETSTPSSLLSVVSPSKNKATSKQASA